MKCKHDWEITERQEGNFETSVCTRCQAYQHVDLMSGRKTVQISLPDGQVIINGDLYCGTCGMLAASGEEEYDWCDHRTGAGCAHHHEENEFEDDDEYGDEHDEVDPDKYIGPSYPNGEPSGPYIS